ncbi:3-hydroxyisobutyrate dehydrogenase [Amnimonas aquatica]|uniref:3-hydroxyisobutyrate dehydrogenase n=1 Tax=Amnimonas aquatica TaxID=2094561 RepID=A0A2P6ATD6_9GAMM|nr:3-hydroxyisobutyrate dehydrogenase [Amnimonas aquatica]PQA46769.1 3-hydroxyisobutyrate dehydrogenase [Amnimonas aquatica]
MTDKIAFIGLGNMGGPMAVNLRKAGFDVTATDLSPEARARVAADGVAVADSAAGALAGAGVVISMLPASRHVEGLYLGDGTAGNPGLLATLPAGTRVIDCSTIAPASARRVAAAAAARGLSMIDAPVSGGTAGAAAGTLTFMVGGDAGAVEAARPFLAAMGRNIFHAGGSGAGQVAKVCNNMLLAIHMIGSAEALSLGVNNGLDPAVLAEIMKQSSGDNWSLQKYNPVPGVMDGVPASRGYSGGFGSDLMLKDLGLAEEAALATGSAIPLGGLARNLYAAHSAGGAGALDFSSIIRLLQKRTD